MKRIINLGLIQMSMNENQDANLNKATRLIQEAAVKGADIICLPELFRSPYFPQDEKSEQSYAEKIPGETGKRLSQAAKENNIVLVAGSVFEQDNKNFYNTSMIFDEKGKFLGKYRKVHIPHDPNFYEQNYFTPGDIGYKVFKTIYGNIAPLICYDQWYPEAARVLALMGADIIFYPTAIGHVHGIREDEGNWEEAWETVQRGHAIANNIIVAAVNRVGREKNMDFWGRSFICDAFGKVVTRGSDKEEIVIAECDLEHGKRIRKGWRFFNNRRIDTYHRLIE